MYNTGSLLLLIISPAWHLLCQQITIIWMAYFVCNHWLALAYAVFMCPIWSEWNAAVSILCDIIIQVKCVRRSYICWILLLNWEMVCNIHLWLTMGDSWVPEGICGWPWVMVGCQQRICGWPLVMGGSQQFVVDHGWWLGANNANAAIIWLLKVFKHIGNILILIGSYIGLTVFPKLVLSF